MYTTNRIRSHIDAIPAGQLFTTRDCLLFGSRAAVDQALCRLVKSGFIKRLARGVFVNPDPDNPIITAWAVAQAKSRAFKKDIMCHAAEAAARLGLTSPLNQEPTFAVSGRSGSFKYGDRRIYMRAASPRKLRLGDTPAGMLVRALWHLGRSACSNAIVAATTLSLGGSHAQALHRDAALAPDWLFRQLCCCQA